jgi:hypothetical protein
MSYIIVTRNPRVKKLVIVTDGDDNVPAEFATEREALDAAGNTTICKAWGYDIIEIPTATD